LIQGKRFALSASLPNRSIFVGNFVEGKTHLGLKWTVNLAESCFADQNVAESAWHRQDSVTQFLKSMDRWNSTSAYKGIRLA
jgi:hypothetical protein